MYDLTQVIKVNDLYYERLYIDVKFSDEMADEKYRFVDDLESDDYDYVTDQRLIDLLDYIFDNTTARIE